jgi:hypothetical protein
MVRYFCEVVLLKVLLISACLDRLPQAMEIREMPRHWASLISQSPPVLVSISVRTTIRCQWNACDILSCA